MRRASWVNDHLFRHSVMLLRASFERILVLPSSLGTVPNTATDANYDSRNSGPIFNGMHTCTVITQQRIAATTNSRSV